MSFWEKIKRALNRIFTLLAVVMAVVWLWKYFGPGSGPVRSAGSAAMRRAGMSFSSMIWLSVAVVCGGYLLWRFMSWLFFRKYFKDMPGYGASEPSREQKEKQKLWRQSQEPPVKGNNEKDNENEKEKEKEKYKETDNDNGAGKGSDKN